MKRKLVFIFSVFFTKIGNLIKMFKSPVKINGKKINRVLFFEPKHIGDALLTTPCLTRIKEIFPDAHIDFAASVGSSQILKNNPNIEEFVIVDLPWYQRIENSDGSFYCKDEFSWKTIKLVSSLIKSKKYDLVVSFSFDIRDNLILYLSKIKYRIGYKDQADKFLRQEGTLVSKLKQWLVNQPRSGDFLLTKAVEYDMSGEIHQVENNLNILSLIEEDSCSCFVHKYKIQVFPSQDNDKKADELLNTYRKKGLKKIILLLPGAGFKIKEIPFNLSIEIIKEIKEKYGYTPILVGGKKELDTFRKIQAIINEIPFIAGDLNLLETAALIKKADLVITADSAPLHIAAATQTPQIVVFPGYNRNEQWLPYNSPHKIVSNKTNCSPCYKLKCFRDKQYCMSEIKVKDILKLINSYF